MPKKSMPMIGKVFGSMKVISKDETQLKNSHKKFIVECVLCKKTKLMYGENIRRTEKIGSSGCDCATRNIKNRASRKGSHVKESYKTWEGMMRRCYSEKHKGFYRYGGRGIIVCQDWHDYDVFAEWLEKNGWVRGVTEVDRINNDGEYSPDNCRVTSRIQNMSNTSKNRFLIINGERITIAEASRRYKVGLTTIKARLDAGYQGIDCVQNRDLRCKHQRQLRANGEA